MNFLVQNDGWSSDAFANFYNQVVILCEKNKEVRILEIGGGRSPLFKISDLPANVVSYTVNDIEQSELDLAPKGYELACFDACGDVSAYAGKFDIIFSKMLAEHVPDGQKFHTNNLSMLKEGGVALHFFPKLYALPFSVNYLLPETLSRRLLFLFFKDREFIVPKFPAKYSWCRGTVKTVGRRISNLGYAQVRVIPFYGHSYYKKIPVVRSIEKLFRKFARNIGLSICAPYVYVFATK